MEAQLGHLWKSPLSWQSAGPLNRALGIGNRYFFIPACILTFMALGLVTSISAAHDMFAYRGLLPPLPRAPLVTGVTEIFAVLWLFEMAERFTKSRWEHMRPLLPRWSKILLVSLLCLLLLYVTNTHS